MIETFIEYFGDFQAKRKLSVTSSSFHSIRSLSECGNFETTPKEVKEALQRDFYVDDISTDLSSASKAKLQIGLISPLKQAQFDLGKWMSSDPELVLSLPPEYREANEKFKFLDEEHTKSLGILWNPSSDKFCFTISTRSKSLKSESITKR